MLAKSSPDQAQANYNKYTEEYLKLKAKSDWLRQRTDDLKDRTAAYYASWNKQAEVQNPELRRQAVEQRADAEKIFSNIKSELEQTRNAFQPYMSNLKDVGTYLKDNVTPAGIKSIGDLTTKANAQSKEVGMHADALVAEIDKITAATGESPRRRRLNEPDGGEGAPIVDEHQRPPLAAGCRLSNLAPGIRGRVSGECISHFAFEGYSMGRKLFVRAVMISLSAVSAQAQTTPGASSPSGPPEDVEVITAEAQTTPQQPLLQFGRPFYQAIQDFKRDLNEKYGLHFALENTLIYQAASGGVDPSDALVNTLGFFSTWKIIRSEDGKDFAGLGFQAETRANSGNSFTELRNDLGSLWSVERLDVWQLHQDQPALVGPAVRRRAAGLPGRKDRYRHPHQREPLRRLGQHAVFQPAVRHQPGPVVPGQRPRLHAARRADGTALPPLHDVRQRRHQHPLAVYDAQRPMAVHGRGRIPPGVRRARPGHLPPDDLRARRRVGRRDRLVVSADQNLSDDLGVFLRYDGNDGGINAIRHLLAVGVSFLTPFGRENDEAGIGVSYSHPSSNDLQDEYSAEAYYRVQLTEGIEVSPDARSSSTRPPAARTLWGYSECDCGYSTS